MATSDEPFQRLIEQQAVASRMSSHTEASLHKTARDADGSSDRTRRGRSRTSALSELRACIIGLSLLHRQINWLEPSHSTFPRAIQSPYSICLGGVCVLIPPSRCHSSRRTDRRAFKLSFSLLLALLLQPFEHTHTIQGKFEAQKRRMKLI